MEFNNIYQGLISGKEKLALVGLGYVGMPIAVEFAKHVKVIGFDINENRVNEFRDGIDATNEVGEAIKNTTVDFTVDPSRLKKPSSSSLRYRRLLTRIRLPICVLWKVLLGRLVRILHAEQSFSSNQQSIPA